MLGDKLASFITFASKLFWLMPSVDLYVATLSPMGFAAAIRMSWDKAV